MEVKPSRRYNGPPKGSQEAKDRMAKVRAAQWAKNNLVVAQPTNAQGGVDNGNASSYSR